MKYKIKCQSPSTEDLTFSIRIFSIDQALTTAEGQEESKQPETTLYCMEYQQLSGERNQFNELVKDLNEKHEKSLEGIERS